MDENITLIEGWARDGLTDEQIAHNMEINPATLYVWKKNYPKINEALKKGKEIVDYQVENSLLKEALKGNVTACIYWLKNRRGRSIANWNRLPRPRARQNLQLMVQT